MCTFCFARFFKLDFFASSQNKIMNKLEELEVSQEEAVNTTTAEEHREHPDRAKMSEFDLFNLSDKDRQGAARVQA